VIGAAYEARRGNARSHPEVQESPWEPAATKGLLKQWIRAIAPKKLSAALPDED
jgi:hypothetical protein